MNEQTPGQNQEATVQSVAMQKLSEEMYSDIIKENREYHKDTNTPLGPLSVLHF